MKIKKVISYMLLSCILISGFFNIKGADAHEHGSECQHVEEEHLHIDDSQHTQAGEFLFEEIEPLELGEMSIMSTSPGAHIHEYAAQEYSVSVDLDGSGSCYKIVRYRDGKCKVCGIFRGTPIVVSQSFYGHTYTTTLRGCDDIWDSWRTACATCGYLYETASRRCIH